MNFSFPPSGKGGPIFNFRSDGRSFADSCRCLIPASAFFEFTGKKYPKAKHRFTLKSAPFMAIAGHVRRADMRQIGRAFNPGLDRASAEGGAVAAFLWHCFAFRLAILLDQHRVIDVHSKGFIDRIEIGAVTIGRKLDAIGKTVLYIVHEGQRIFAVTTADQP